MRYSVEMWFFRADSLFRWVPSWIDETISLDSMYWRMSVCGADSLREVVPPLTGWLVVDDRSEEIWILSIVLLGCWWSVQCWRCVRFLRCVDKLAYTLIIFSGISVAWWRRWRRWVSDLGEVVCSDWLSGDFVVLDQASSFTSIWNTSSQKSSVGSM